MTDKLLVCVSAEKVTAAQWRHRGIADCRVVGNDAAGLAAFNEFLLPLDGVPAYLMADAVEEDYRLEMLPHAFGADRGEMLRRKLRQHYRNTPYVSACLLGRQSGSRRDDRYLFSALTNGDLIAAWLQALVGRGLPIAGIFLLPMTSTGLLDALQLRAPNHLLVSQQSGGLRLTFVRERQLRLSRLTRAESSKSGAHKPRFVTEEISNTRIYLHALKAARLDERLTVVLIDSNDQLGDVARRIAEESPGLECIHVGHEALSSRLGLAPALLNLGPELIFLQMLGRRTPGANLAQANVTAGFRRHRTRRAIYASAGTMALAGAAWSGVNAWQISDAYDHQMQTARETNRIQAQYQHIAREFPDTPTSSENLGRAVEIAHKLQQKARSPELLMQVVSRAMEQAPGIVIEELAWKHDSSELAGTGAAAPPPMTPKAARIESGLVSGQIKPFGGNFRTAIEAIQAFGRRLAQDPAVAEVRLVKLPLNIDPGLSLSGNTVEDGEQPRIADFKLVLLLKAER